MKDRAFSGRTSGFTRRAILVMGCLGLIAGWGGGSLQAEAAQDAEELFTPYLVASAAIPSPPEVISAPKSDLVLQPEARTPFSTLVGIAVRLVRRGHYGMAIALLEPYRAQEDFLTLHALGVAYVRTERNSEAFNILLRAHRLNPAVPGPLLPAALACARMARSCDEYRRLALDYIALGGKFKKFADKIANHQPFTLVLPRRS